MKRRRSGAAVTALIEQLRALAHEGLTTKAAAGRAGITPGYAYLLAGEWGIGFASGLSKPTTRSGDRFGSLVVLSVDAATVGPRRARCRCACGRSRDALVTDLVRGHLRSCGVCGRAAAGRRTAKTIAQGTRFGSLTVEKRAARASAKQEAFFWCMCRCGNRLMVRGQALRSGKSRSCGCSRRTRHGQDRSKD